MGSRVLQGASRVLLVAALAAACAGTSGSGRLGLSDQIELDAARPEDALEILPRSGGAEVQDGAGRRVVWVGLEQGLLTIEAANREQVGVVTRLDDVHKGFRILSAPGGRPLYTLQLEPDGDYRLTDGRGRVLYQFKVRDYGFKIVDAKGGALGRVRVKSGKISIRDASGETVLSTRDPLPPLAAACLSLWEFPLEYGAALGVAVIHWGTPS